MEKVRSLCFDLTTRTDRGQTAGMGGLFDEKGLAVVAINISGWKKKGWEGA